MTAQRVPTFSQWAGSLLTFFRELSASGNLECRPTLIYIDMIENTHNYLATVFGYPMHLPDAPTTRRHYTSTTGSWGPRYVPPKEPKERIDLREKPEFSATKLQMLEIVKKSDIAMTSLDISKQMKCCHNHASLTMTAFFKKDMVKRKLVSSGRHRWYIYYVEQRQLDKFNQNT